MITKLKKELAVMNSILMQFRVDVKEKTFINNFAEFNGVQDDSLSVINSVMMGALGYGKDLVQGMFNSLYF